MFGALTFGDGPFGSDPFTGPLIVQAAGTMTGAVTLAGAGSALASSSGVMAVGASLTGGLVALIESSGVMTQGWSMTPRAVAVWNSQGSMQGRADFFPKLAAVYNSRSTMVGGFLLQGYQLRAYDQLFPPIVTNNDVVQIGRRLYIWKANLGRWTPGGPAP